MKYGVKVEGDRRNMNIQVGMQKEEGEKDFFEGLPSFDLSKLGKIVDDEEDLELIDQVEDETE